jgi:hypothetical protein
VFNKEAGRWLHWSETLAAAYRIPNDAAFQEILVPTLDSARYKFLLDTFVGARKPTLFIGPTGTGKLEEWRGRERVVVRSAGGRGCALHRVTPRCRPRSLRDGC